MPSAPWNCTENARLYQGAASGARDAVVPVTAGALASYLSAKGELAALPALSRQLPVTDAPALSGPEYDFAASHVSRPDVASVPLKEIESAWLYQPFASAARDAAAVTCGAVASYFSATWPFCVFPALSRHAPATAVEAASGPEYVLSASHVATPEVTSVAVKLTARGALYQPSGPAGRLAAAVTVGLVASYLSAAEVDALFPALSRHAPPTEAAAESGPEYVLSASHASTPEVASVAVKPTATGAVYQPVAPAARAGVAVACGAVASYLSGSTLLPTLPAASVQLPLTSAAALSGPEYVLDAEHVATPATGSVPVKVTPIGALYQPFPFAARAGVAVTAGAVPSYLKAKERGATFPAWSRHAPPTETVAESGPEYPFGASHDSRPEVASLPEKVTVSAWLCQPLTSAVRDGVAVAAGAVSSYLSVKEPEALTLPARSVQVPPSATEASSGPE